MAEHPSIQHKKQAIRHLHRAADDLAGSIERHKRGEHASAQEAAKQAAGRIGEAQSHLSDAARLHAEYERAELESRVGSREYSNSEHPTPTPQDEGSHWNDAGDSES